MVLRVCRTTRISVAMPSARNTQAIAAWSRTGRRKENIHASSLRVGILALLASFMVHRAGAASLRNDDFSSFGYSSPNARSIFPPPGRARMSAAANESLSRRARLERYFRERPDLALIAPFMTYLLLLGMRSAAPPALLPLAIAIIAVGAGAVAALVWKHLPPLGKPHAVLA